MWVLGYLGRAPGVLVPSQVLFVLFIFCLVGGGYVLARWSGLGWRHGAAAGFLCGVLNLLVLGSFLSSETPNVVRPSAALWVPGFVLIAACLTAVGALLGRRAHRSDTQAVQWDWAFVGVNVTAALFLLVVGGLVTSTETGLAVVDWPNSYGYNMFLYPFSKMTGGIYFEHAHRLFAFLVGLTTLVMAILLQRRERRTWVRAFAWAAVALVVVQAFLGGLRVTGVLTLSTDASVMRPSIVLALVHGVVAQVFFGMLVALMAITSPTWRAATSAVPRDSASGGRWLGGVLLGALLVQLLLGAAQRHLTAMLMVHIGFGIAIVAPLAIHAGMRAWGKNEDQPILRRLGLGLAVAVSVQIGLGFAAYAATGDQWFGAVLVGLSVGLFCWHFRLVQPVSEPVSAAVPGSVAQQS
jgi:cytochrome c oxidase assembly protein subunit 15